MPVKNNRTNSWAVKYKNRIFILYNFRVLRAQTLGWLAWLTLGPASLPLGLTSLTTNQWAVKYKTGFQTSLRLYQTKILSLVTLGPNSPTLGLASLPTNLLAVKYKGPLN